MASPTRRLVTSTDAKDVPSATVANKKPKIEKNENVTGFFELSSEGLVKYKGEDSMCKAMSKINEKSSVASIKANENSNVNFNMAQAMDIELKFGDDESKKGAKNAKNGGKEESNNSSVTLGNASGSVEMEGNETDTAKGTNPNISTVTTTNIGNAQNSARQKYEDRALIQYPQNFQGEIFVLVDSSSHATLKNEKMTNGLTLFSQIRDLRIKDIDHIQAIGRTLYKIIFKSTYHANNFVIDQRVIQRDLKPFIPRTALEIYGIVKGVPLCFSDDDVAKEAITTIPIVSVKRFTRKDPNTDKYIATMTLKIGFSGNNIPTHIIYNYTKLNVEFFIPPLRQCENCGRIGHTKMSCKTKTRCLTCGKAECQNPKCVSNTCILCNNQGHSARDRNICPQWEKEAKIARVRAVKKLTRKEALDLYYPRGGNRFEILEVEETDFPALENEYSNIVDKDTEINRNFTKKQYSHVAKKGNERYKTPPPRESPPKIVRQKNPINPVFNSPEYQKGLVSQFEKFINQLIKISQKISLEHNNSNALEEIQGLKGQFEAIIAQKDTLHIQQSNPFKNHENNAI
ncbi:uncharacterized protein [Eurosta solidaginis]|uniref:uncharacterized protein n=1 Tax=Eurosta solidaginis TaxID=178769 RepID=UPI003530CF55